MTNASTITAMAEAFNDSQDYGTLSRMKPAYAIVYELEIKPLREALKEAADHYVCVVANSQNDGNPDEAMSDPVVKGWYAALALSAPEGVL